MKRVFSVAVAVAAMILPRTGQAQRTGALNEWECIDHSLEHSTPELLFHGPFWKDKIFFDHNGSGRRGCLHSTTALPK